jgi:hypothetical protein
MYPSVRLKCYPAGRNLGSHAVFSNHPGYAPRLYPQQFGRYQPLEFPLTKL